MWVWGERPHSAMNGHVVQPRPFSRSRHSLCCSGEASISRCPEELGSAPRVLREALREAPLGLQCVLTTFRTLSPQGPGGEGTRLLQGRGLAACLPAEGTQPPATTLLCALPLPAAGLLGPQSSATRCRPWPTLLGTTPPSSVCSVGWPCPSQAHPTTGGRQSGRDAACVRNSTDSSR